MLQFLRTAGFKDTVAAMSVPETTREHVLTRSINCKHRRSSMPYKAGGDSSWTEECWKEQLRKLGSGRGTPLHLQSGLSYGRTIFKWDVELRPCLEITGSSSTEKGWPLWVHSMNWATIFHPVNPICSASVLTSPSHSSRQSSEICWSPYRITSRRSRISENKTVAAASSTTSQLSVRAFPLWAGWLW